jgi:glutamyl-tRNA synthetase
VTLSPAFFDEKKMTHVNADYIRRLDPADFLARVEPFVSNPAAMEPLRLLVEPIQGRTRLLADVDGAVDFLLTDDVEIDEDSWQKGVVKHEARSETMLDGVIAGFADIEWTADDIRAVVETVGVDAGFVNDEGNVQLGKAQAPVRVATTGRSVGPPLFEALEVLGRERTLDRLRAARRRV